MEIVKMHGLGNDFILIEEQITQPAELAQKLCRRRLDIGADGLLLVEQSKHADIKMRIINADGSEAEMCGNGIRCFARYVYDKGIVPKQEMTIETLAGTIKPELIIKDGEVEAIRVNMGRPSFDPEKIPVLTEDPLHFEVAGQQASCVLMGVPHTMVVVENLDETPIGVLGPQIERDALFPRKTNVNFVQVMDKTNVRLCTWERGAGQTLACGTGATAMGVLLYKLGLTEKEIDVHVEPGTMHIENAEDGRAYMTGPAEYVFQGETI